MKSKEVLIHEFRKIHLYIVVKIPIFLKKGKKLGSLTKKNSGLTAQKLRSRNEKLSFTEMRLVGISRKSVQKKACITL